MQFKNVFILESIAVRHCIRKHATQRGHVQQCTLCSMPVFHFNHTLFLQFLFLIHSCVTLLSPSSLTDRITSCPTIHSGFVLSPALLPPLELCSSHCGTEWKSLNPRKFQCITTICSRTRSGSSAFQLYVNRPSTSIYSNDKDKVLPAGQYL